MFHRSAETQLSSNTETSIDKPLEESTNYTDEQQDLTDSTDQTEASQESTVKVSPADSMKRAKKWSQGFKKGFIRPAYYAWKQKPEVNSWPSKYDTARNFSIRLIPENERLFFEIRNKKGEMIQSDHFKNYKNENSIKMPVNSRILDFL